MAFVKLNTDSKNLPALMSALRTEATAAENTDIEINFLTTPATVTIKAGCIVSPDTVERNYINTSDIVFQMTNASHTRIQLNLTAGTVYSGTSFTNYNLLKKNKLGSGSAFYTFPYYIDQAKQIFYKEKDNLNDFVYKGYLASDIIGMSTNTTLNFTTEYDTSAAIAIAKGAFNPIYEVITNIKYMVTTYSATNNFGFYVGSLYNFYVFKNHGVIDTMSIKTYVSYEDMVGNLGWRVVTQVIGSGIVNIYADDTHQFVRALDI